VRSLRSVLLVGALAVSGAAGVALAAPAEAAGPVAGTYVAVTPFRAADTVIAHRKAIAVRVGGRAHVPGYVAAVAVTLTVSSPTNSGGLIAYAAGTKRPGVRNLLYAKGRPTAVSAIVRTSRTGRIDVFNAAASGRTKLTVDVSGYYVPGAPSAETSGVLHTVTPTHALAGRAIGAHRTLTAPLGGRDGVPSAGVGAVAVLLSASSPARSGALVAFRAGGTRPRAGITSFTKGTSATGFGLVPTDGYGRISIYNASRGSVRVAVDIVGYTVGGTPTTAGSTQLGTPAPVVAASRVRRNHARTVTVVGHGGVPRSGVSAVLLTVTATGERAAGAMVAWRTGVARPGTTNLQFGRGRPASNLVLSQVSSTGAVSIRNVSRGTLTLSVDVIGYVRSTTALISAPNASNSRYVRTIGQSGDWFARPDATGDGCVDATAGSTLVLLELGAQLNDRTGVELSATSIQVRYPDLVRAIDNYLTSFAGCPHSGSATVALGTNNDGDFAKFPATARGAMWADEVVDKVQRHVGITVVGANDIEQGFASTEAQARQWESGYLQATTAGLVFNGSADGCPITLGHPGEKCAYWTEQQIYDLAHDGTRVQALPQVYTAAQAVQWANIDATGGGGIRFAGVLTEYQACPARSAACPTASYPPAAGWLALYRAIATTVPAPQIPAATDLRVDG
jgi:hypothetical protein